MQINCSRNLSVMTAPERIRVSCGDCPIRHRAVCALCDADELATLERIKSYRSFAPGTTIAMAGDDMRHLSSIVKGAATMSRTLEDGRRQTVGLLLPSDFIGRPGREVSPFDVEALTEVTLCRFERQTFERMVLSTPHIATRLLDMTLDELDAARDWAVVLGRLTAREKVAAFLASIARRMAGSQGQTGLLVDLPMTREAMADHLGLTIETTSRQIGALKRDGVIALEGNRRIRVPDLRLLMAEAGDDSDGGLLV